MYNYRKAVAVYIQEQGISSDEQFQSGIADMKDTYLGDENITVMNEFRENNGRLISHPVVQGTAPEVIKNYSYSDAIISNQRHN